MIKQRHTKRQGHCPLTLPPLYSDAQSKEWNFRRSRDNGSFTHSAIIFCWLDSMAQLLPQEASCVFWVINNASCPRPPRPRPDSQCGFCCCLKFYPVISEISSTHTWSSIINDERKWNNFSLTRKFSPGAAELGKSISRLEEGRQHCNYQGSCALAGPLCHLTAFIQSTNSQVTLNKSSSILHKL